MAIFLSRARHVIKTKKPLLWSFCFYFTWHGVVDYVRIEVIKNLETF